MLPLIARPVVGVKEETSARAARPVEVVEAGEPGFGFGFGFGFGGGEKTGDIEGGGIIEIAFNFNQPISNTTRSGGTGQKKKTSHIPLTLNLLIDKIGTGASVIISLFGVLIIA